MSACNWSPVSHQKILTPSNLKLMHATQQIVENFRSSTLSTFHLKGYKSRFGCLGHKEVTVKNEKILI